MLSPIMLVEAKSLKTMYSRPIVPPIFTSDPVTYGGYLSISFGTDQPWTGVDPGMSESGAAL